MALGFASTRRILHCSGDVQAQHEEGTLRSMPCCCKGIELSCAPSGCPGRPLGPRWPTYRCHRRPKRRPVQQTATEHMTATPRTASGRAAEARTCKLHGPFTFVHVKSRQLRYGGCFETALCHRSADRQCMRESTRVFIRAPGTKRNAANLGQIMDKRAAAVTHMRQSADQTCRRMPGPHATAASGVLATHQGYGSEARDAGGDLSGAQEEGQQQKHPLQGAGVQLGCRDHGEHSQRLRRHRTTGGQLKFLMTGTGRQAGM